MRGRALHGGDRAYVYGRGPAAGARAGRRDPGGGRRHGLGTLTGALALALMLSAVGASQAVAAGGAPTVETEKVTSVARTGLVLNASVNPNGSAVTECHFEYGTSESSLDDQAPCSYSPGFGETPVPVYAKVEGLSESTTYYFRIYANSAEGESFGSVEQATTLPTAPTANAVQATAIGHTSATLGGDVNPNDSEVTECYFEWGAAPDALTNKVSCSSAPGSGSEPVAVSATLAHLEESTDYYFRLVAGNSYGSNHSGREVVATLPNAPGMKSEPARTVTHTAATLRGEVNPGGALVQECYFLWGTGVFTNSVPCEPTDIGSGETLVPVTAQLTGLSESTTYQFHLVAINKFGLGENGNRQFTTLPDAPKAVNRKVEELAAESVLLRAEVNPEGATVTECVFEYGPTPALGKGAPCSTLPGGGEQLVKVTAAVSGLEPLTSYLARIKVRNAFGVVYTGTEAFTTFVAGLRPVVDKIKPPKGPASGGTQVTIDGENLVGATAVTFGETETKDITSDLADSLTVVAPPGAGMVNVIVTTASGESKITSTDHFTYGGPTITGVSPKGGPESGGTEVTVTGYGFEPGTEATHFVFGKAAAGSVDCTSTTICTVSTPTYTKAVTVEVRATVNGKTNPRKEADFTYTS